MSWSKIRKQLEDHPIVGLVGYAVLIGGFVWGVAHFYYSERIATTKEQYEVKLASINRSLAGGDYMDVAKFLVPVNQRSRLPQNSKFHPEDSFYAVDPSRWMFKRITDIEFFNSIYGGAGTHENNDITSLAPVNVWQRGDFIPIGGHGIINNIAPCIYVQKLPADKLIERLEINSPFPQETNEELRKLRVPSIFKGDVVGALLSETLSGVFTTLRFMSETDVNLRNITKVSNVLYCQILLTMRNVTVGTRKVDRYYINFETIVISTSDNVYTICDFVPSEEPIPRGPVAAEVTEWLNGFAIPIE